MAPPPKVPAALTTRPFLGRTAVGDGALTEKQLRSSCWLRLLRGVYVHRDVVVDDAVRLDALRLVVRPGRVVCGRTAAWLLGVWRPRAGEPVPLEVTDPLPRNGHPVEGLGRRRLTLHDGLSVVENDVIDLDGLSVLSPWRTCFDLMRERGLVEAVVVADAFAWAGAIDLTTMSVYAAGRIRWPHVRQTRVALNLASAFARSPGETRTRMVLVLGGLPEPLVNVALLDAAGGVLGVPDLTVIGRRRTVGVEYDGAYHEEDGQHEADLRRENRLTSIAGMPLLRYDRESVRTQRDLILHEVSTAAGLRPTQELRDRDFRRTPRSLAW